LRRLLYATSIRIVFFANTKTKVVSLSSYDIGATHPRPPDPDRERPELAEDMDTMLSATTLSVGAALTRMKALQFKINISEQVSHQ
jgi:hypothetical protein